ncbi:MAG: class I SAM-dependent methyltransferase [Kiritimatiellae bacterium]|nr:class I SAM-dependent methyltransferase [Kiritimatiellia bacterium]
MPPLRSQLLTALRQIRAGRFRLDQAEKWLLANGMERMDANRTDIFSPSRAEFHKARYRFAGGFAADRAVLDIACGTGYGSDILLREGKAAAVYGVDIDPRTIEYAGRVYARDGLVFREGTILDIPFADGFFDLVVSFETIEHVADEERQLQEVRRVLKPGGQYVLSTPNDWGVGEVAPFHVRSYTLASLRGAISSCFRIANVFNQNSGTPGREENRGQPAGITKTDETNAPLAECYLIVAEKPPV